MVLDVLIKKIGIHTRNMRVTLTLLIYSSRGSFYFCCRWGWRECGITKLHLLSERWCSNLIQKKQEEQTRYTLRSGICYTRRINFHEGERRYNKYTDVQSWKSVFAYLYSKQILPFGLAWQYRGKHRPLTSFFQYLMTSLFALTDPCIIMTYDIA